MPADPKLAHLPVSSRVTLWRAVDAIVRGDPTVKAAFKLVRSWQGRSDDKAPLALAEAPALRLTPKWGDQRYRSPQDQTGWLEVEVEILARGSCVDDVDRLYYAVERSLCPGDPAARNVVINRLQRGDVGATKGLAEFNQPALAPAPGEGDAMHALGSFRVEYRINLNS